MPNTPNQRSTRSNSNSNTQITLSDIKTLIEKSRHDLLQMLAEKMDNQAKKIDSISQRLDEITNENNLLRKKNEILEERIESISSSVFEEVEDRYRRQKNIIISGIPEQRTGDLTERKESDLEKVKKLLEHLSASINKDDITTVHRVGKTGTSIDRLLKVAFKNREAKEEVIRKSKQLRDIPAYRKTFINPDLTLKQRHQRKALDDELKNRRGLGQDVVIWKGKVVEKSMFTNFH